MFWVCVSFGVQFEVVLLLLLLLLLWFFFFFPPPPFFSHSLLCHFTHTSWNLRMNSYLQQKKMPFAILLDLQAVPGNGGVGGNSHSSVDPFISQNTGYPWSSVDKAVILGNVRLFHHFRFESCCPSPSPSHYSSSALITGRLEISILEEAGV